MAPSQPKLPPWGSAVAGASGAVLANALVYPLDIVKTRLQVQVTPRKQPTTGRESGLKADSEGGEAGKEDGDADADADDDNNDDIDEKTEKPVHYSSTWDAITKIVDSDGLSGLYAGMGGSLAGVASTNFAYFYWYTIVRQLYARSRPGPKPSTAVELSLGAVAGALAQLFTIPVAVVTTRQQTQLKSERKSFFETGREVVESDDGVTGLWRGLKASLVLVVNPAITYGAYERLRDVLFPAEPGRAARQLKPGQAFLLGALSKAIATVVTQPLIVAKVGLQSRPPPERKGRPFNGFVDVLRYIIRHEGPLGLFKGIGPQLMKGLLVQGLLMMTKERVELVFALLFARMRGLRERRRLAA